MGRLMIVKGDIKGGKFVGIRKHSYWGVLCACAVFCRITLCLVFVWLEDEVGVAVVILGWCGFFFW